MLGSRFALTSSPLWLVSLAALGCGGGSAATDDATPAPIAVTVSVDLSTTYQTMVGFGAAVAYFDSLPATNPMGAALYQTVFNDLGLEVLRIANWYQNNGDNGASMKSTATFVQGAVAALGRKPIILMSSWNPPFTGWTSPDGTVSYPSLKSNGVNDAGGTLTKTASGGYDYADFGQWWADSLTAYAAQGVVPDYISIQNEPDFTTTNEGTCLFDPVETTGPTGHAGYGPALDAVEAAIASTPGLAMPKLIGPEISGIAGAKLTTYMDGIAQDPSALGELDAVAHHLYNGGTDAIPNSFDNALENAATAAGGKPLWMSEYAPQTPNMFTTAWLIQNSVTVESVSTYLYWDLFWPANPAGSTGPPEGLVSVSSTGFTINDSYYAVQHFAKGIDVGWTRVGSSSSNGDVTVSAFASPDGSALTLVLINIGNVDAQVTIDPGSFTGATSAVYRTSGDATSSTSERFAALGPLPAGNLLDLPSQAIATVMLSP